MRQFALLDEHHLVGASIKVHGAVMPPAAVNTNFHELIRLGLKLSNLLLDGGEEIGLAQGL